MLALITSVITDTPEDCFEDVSHGRNRGCTSRSIEIQRRPVADVAANVSAATESVGRCFGDEAVIARCFPRCCGWNKQNRKSEIGNHTGIILTRKNKCVVYVIESKMACPCSVNGRYDDRGWRACLGNEQCDEYDGRCGHHHLFFALFLPTRSPVRSSSSLALIILSVRPAASYPVQAFVYSAFASLFINESQSRWLIVENVYNLWRDGIIDETGKERASSDSLFLMIFRFTALGIPRNR